MKYGGKAGRTSHIEEEDVTVTGIGKDEDKIVI